MEKIARFCICIATLLVIKNATAAELAHPRLFIAAKPTAGLRTVAELRHQLANSDHLAQLWRELIRRAGDDHGSPPITPSNYQDSERNEQHRRNANPDYYVCRAAGQRLLRCALASLVCEDGDEKIRYRDTALRQIQCLFDEKEWPDWRDMAHRQFPLDLRNGSLGRDIAIAYDWLYATLNDSQKQLIVKGLNARAIQPFWEAVEADVDWINGRNNWMTCVVGGMGIVGLALGGDHPDAERLVAFAHERMVNYLQQYGRNGEFNEAIGYSTATRLPILYFGAQRYASASRDDQLSQWPFVETAVWNAYTLLPPGRLMAFGDAHVDRLAQLDYLAPIAAASRNGVIQWVYLTCQSTTDATGYDLPIGLLGFDASVPPLDPTNRLPLGQNFPKHSGVFVSRSSWNPRSAACIVYGKAGIELNHEHHDAGQVCIDGLGQRLIVDLGSPPNYPPDYFGKNRWEYYNASWFGHNVLTTEGEVMIAPRGAAAKTIACEFDDRRGGYWQLDLKDFYPDALRVTRSVVHLLPGIVAVLDQANFCCDKTISLRWHTVNRAIPRNRSFVVQSANARLVASIVPLDDGPLTIRQDEHQYESPFDHGRDGNVLRQRRESFVLVRRSGRSMRLLTVFAVSANSGPHPRWRHIKNGAEIDTPDGIVSVLANDETLVVESQTSSRRWSVTLPD